VPSADGSYEFEEGEINSEDDYIPFDTYPESKPKPKCTKNSPLKEFRPIPSGPAGGRRLYVGNLPRGVVKAQIKEFFQGYQMYVDWNVCYG
jgi:RNA recognition motif-containing protein